MKTDPIKSGELNTARANSGKFETPFINATRAIRNLNRLSGFQVGDVLIRKIGENIEKMEGSIPMRYIVIHKDEHGFLYIKRFLKGGGLSKTVTCITLSTKPQEAYEVDSQYANSIILEDESLFNPQADVKKARKAREKAKRTNIKNTIYLKETDTEKAIEEAIRYIDSKIKVGQKMWNYRGVEFVIQEIKTVQRRKTIRKGGKYPLSKAIYEKEVVPGKASREVVMVEPNGQTIHRAIDTEIQGLMIAKPVKVGDLV